MGGRWESRENRQRESLHHWLGLIISSRLIAEPENWQILSLNLAQRVERVQLSHAWWLPTAVSCFNLSSSWNCLTKSKFIKFKHTTSPRCFWIYFKLSKGPWDLFLSNSRCFFCFFCCSSFQTKTQAFILSRVWQEMARVPHSCETFDCPGRNLILEARSCYFPMPQVSSFHHTFSSFY